MTRALDALNKVKPGRGPESDRRTNWRRRLIALTMIAAPANDSALLPTKADDNKARHPGVIARGHLPLTRRGRHLIDRTIY